MKTILVAAGVSLVLAMFGTPAAIKLLRRRGYGQLIREVGPAHSTKRGTPTMGGAVIVVATLIGYLVGHVVTNDPISASGVLVLFLMTGLGLVGFIDDFIKIYKQTSLGLRSGAKLAGQAVVGAVFAIEVLRYPDGIALSPRQVMERNFWFCTIDDPSTIDTRHAIGVDHIMVEVDYPHGDSTWPDTQDVIRQCWGHIPDDELRAMCCENAAALYRHPLPDVVLPR